MPFDRIIQDSDDEEDPLSAEFAPPATNAPNASEHQEGGGLNPPPPEDNYNAAPPAVDFDQFLQSQEAIHPGGSTSQQLREERWIPGDARRESNGWMMTEIGRAQQRLLDDDELSRHGSIVHASGWSQSLPSGPAPSDELQLVPNVPVQHEIGVYNEQAGLGNGSEHPEIPVVSVPQHNTAYTSVPQHIIGPGNSYLNDGKNAYHVPAHPELPYTSVSSHDLSESGASYNIFDSSLRPTSDSYADNTAAPNPNGTVPTDIEQKSPRRCNSMQPPFWSPHDTEPFSSIASPQAGRSKSDMNGMRPSQTSTDELAAPAPVAIDLTAGEKKRGRKKKQVSQNEENGEHQPIHNEGNEQTPKSEKRKKPGRPRKDSKVPREDMAPDGQEYVPVAAEEERPKNQSKEVDSTEANAPKNAKPSENQDSQTHVPGETSLQSVQIAELSKPAKEPKKKKLKRGKTTSVTLTKTHDSDVEDDVIWVEDRPLNPEPKREESKREEPQDNAPQGPSDGQEVGQSTDQPLHEPQAQAPAPKKRGRKRKTTEQSVVEEKSHQPDDTAHEQPPAGPDCQDHVPTNNTVPDVPGVQDGVESVTKDSEIPANADTAATHPPEDTKENHAPPSTPCKASGGVETPNRGPTKHSPISSTSKVPYRVGLSRRARIAPLLKVVKR